MRRTWGAACKRAGVDGVSLYEGTKHSSATYLKAQGVDDRVLAKIMGHSDPRSVEKYAKIEGETLRATMSKLNTD